MLRSSLGGWHLARCASVRRDPDRAVSSVSPLTDRLVEKLQNALPILRSGRISHLLVTPSCHQPKLTRSSGCCMQRQRLSWWHVAIVQTADEQDRAGSAGDRGKRRNRARPDTETKTRLQREKGFDEHRHWPPHHKSHTRTQRGPHAGENRLQHHRVGGYRPATPNQRRRTSHGDPENSDRRSRLPLLEPVEGSMDIERLAPTERMQGAIRLTMAAHVQGQNRVARRGEPGGILGDSSPTRAHAMHHDQAGSIVARAPKACCQSQAIFRLEGDVPSRQRRARIATKDTEPCPAQPNRTNDPEQAARRDHVGNDGEAGVARHETPRQQVAKAVELEEQRAMSHRARAAPR